MRGIMAEAKQIDQVHDEPTTTKLAREDVTFATVLTSVANRYEGVDG